MSSGSPELSVIYQSRLVLQSSENNRTAYAVLQHCGAADPAAQRRESDPSRSAKRFSRCCPSERKSAETKKRQTKKRQNVKAPNAFRATVVARLGEHRGVDNSATKAHKPRSERGFRARSAPSLARRGEACAGGRMQAADRGQAASPSSAPPPPPTPTHPPRAIHKSQLMLFPTGSGDGPGRCDTAGGRAAGKRGAATLPGRVAAARPGNEGLDLQGSPS